MTADKEIPYRVSFNFSNPNLRKASPLNIDVKATSRVEALALAEAELDVITGQYDVAVKEMKNDGAPIKVGS